MSRVFLCLVLLIVSCGKNEGGISTQQERFVAAMVESSRDLKDEDIYDGLVSLRYGASEDVEWRIEGADSLILVSSLQSCDWEFSHVAIGESFTTSELPDSAVWVTIPKELNRELLASGDIADSVALNNRFLELIGMRPDDANSVVSLMWVNKNDLLRPSYDPDPTTNFGAVEYPDVISPEWYKEWFEANIEYSYESPSEGLNYPFTRLGYTYDWGEARDRYGVSEFIAAPSSTLTLSERMGCWSYYRAILGDDL